MRISKIQSEIKKHGIYVRERLREDIFAQVVDGFQQSDQTKTIIKKTQKRYF